MKKIFVCGKRENFQNYAEALEACGAQGVFSEAPEDAAGCDALLLTGGGDVDPARYGQACAGSGFIDPERDERELQTIRLFLNAGKPILGICRGLQILNVALGGDLIQDIETAADHKHLPDVGDQVHPVQVPEDSFLFPLYGGAFPVNSAHHQAAGKVAPDLRVAARAQDGTVEALACPEKKLYAVQWHPERMAFRHSRPDTVDGRLIFEFFLGLPG